ncbi:MAG: PRC-barrel domain-containing protein [Anaerolineales bacterium]
MQFRQNAEVLSRKGERVGVIERVVIHPGTKEITHLVVEEGWLFTEKKLIPIRMIEYTNPMSVRLKASDEEIEKLPEFKEEEFVPVREGDLPDYRSQNARPLYWYPPVGAFWWQHGFSPFYPMPRYVKYEEQQIPEGTIALREGSRVISKDGQHVGDIESVIADPDEMRVTHFVISQGLLFKDHKLVPAAWIQTVTEEQVLLNVESGFLERLPEYQPSATN